MACPYNESRVELGFAEKTNSWQLRSKFFPSKFGGKPAWLALKKLPRTLICFCGEPLTFILQAYAPVDDHPTAFHRTLFIFGCQPCVDKKKPDSIVVFRSQLGLVNDFYPDVPAVEVEEGSESPSAADFQLLCCVCGCPGPQMCSLCKQRNYCSKQHQILDWKKAHKFVCVGVKKSDNEPGAGRDNRQQAPQITDNAEDVQLESMEIDQANTVDIDELATRMSAQSCLGKSDFTGLDSEDHSLLKVDWEASVGSGQNGMQTFTKPSTESNSKDTFAKTRKKREKPAKDYLHKGILPEFDIEMEPEEIMENEEKNDTQQDLTKYLEGLDKDSIACMKEMAHCNEKDLKEIENISKSFNDKAYKRFKKIVDHYPEQIIRYCKAGKPLWVSSQDLPKQVPSCELCGSPRIFEFQVMPHALNIAKNDLLDWGTLAVYTCAKNCNTDEYVKEFVHRQDFSQ
ncbi:programmed cell death protein 2-like [Varroa jacobsoni]|uniref:programmed cell death protein 2-like n=1 Tax=Varroa jacobsoni TaxID=62625 RepID=UPI000BF4143B|nr:programmed cell death protein 2-like [Varroa jacobsoni]